MSRTPARCTQADIARAIRALMQAGGPGAVEVLPDGTIRVIPGATASGLTKPVEKEREIVL